MSVKNKLNFPCNFSANLWDPAKCANCFKLMEEHLAVISGDHAIKKKIIKCDYLFIAPTDWPLPNFQKTKRWQRRWFNLYDNGELTWSLDEQPETIPQGTLDMSTVVEVANAESLTDNQYSLSLTNSKGSSIFIKGTSNEEIRGWELKFKSSMLTAGNSSGALISNSNSSSGSSNNKRRMTIGGTTMVSQSSSQLSSPSACEKNNKSSISSVGTTSSNNSSTSSSSISKSSRYLSDVSLMSPRGDPDGCGEKSVVDHGPLRKGWLLKYGQGSQVNNSNNNMNTSQEDTCWSKYWFVLRNSKLLYFTNADEEECLGSLTLDVNSQIESIESSRHYGFNVQSWSLAAITNGMRGIWIKSLESAIKTNLDNDHHHHLSEETTVVVVKSHGIIGKDTKEDQRTIVESNNSSSNNSSNNNNTTSVVLSPLLKSKKNLKWRKKAVLELKEEFHKFNVPSHGSSSGSSCSNNVSTTSINSNSSSNPSYGIEDTSLVDEIVELRATVRQMENEIECLSQEKMILSLRLNDFTEKLYQSEKLNKQIRLKMSRVKGQSLKDKQVEIELLNKIAMLEDEIKTFNFQQQQQQQQYEDVVNGRPCAKCSVLQEVIKDREVKLSELENCIGDMEIQFHRKVQELRDFITRPSEFPSECHDVRVKYQREVGELKNLCTKGLEALENSHRRMIAELEEKHRREIQSLRIEKEAALQEETNATLAALDALRKNHELELQREMTRFKEEFIRKFQDGQDLSALHREHEEELAEIKNEILLLSNKYGDKCVEAAKLEENIENLQGLLLEAKRRILEGVLCYSIDNNNDKSNNDSESNSKSTDCPSQTKKSILRSPSLLSN